MTTYDQFIRDGFYIDVPKRFTARLSKIKTRRFSFQAPPIGIMPKLLNLYEKMELPDTIDDIKAESRRQALLSCRVAAVGHLGIYSGIPGLARVIAWYLYFHVDASTLDHIQKMIFALSDYPAFTNSVRFMSAAPRSTASE